MNSLRFSGYLACLRPQDYKPPVGRDYGTPHKYIDLDVNSGSQAGKVLDAIYIAPELHDKIKAQLEADPNVQIVDEEQGELIPKNLSRWNGRHQWKLLDLLVGDRIKYLP